MNFSKNLLLLDGGMKFEGLETRELSVGTFLWKNSALRNFERKVLMSHFILSMSGLSGVGVNFKPLSNSDCSS